MLTLPPRALALVAMAVSADTGSGAGPGAAPGAMLLRKLPGAVATHGARCLDGSPTGYYHRFNATSADWHIILMGGGWCFTPAECRWRALNDPSGTTHNYAPVFNSTCGSGPLRPCPRASSR